MLPLPAGPPRSPAPAVEPPTAVPREQPCQHPWPGSPAHLRQASGAPWRLTNGDGVDGVGVAIIVAVVVVLPSVATGHHEDAAKAPAAGHHSVLQGGLWRGAVRWTSGGGAGLLCFLGKAPPAPLLGPAPSCRSSRSQDTARPRLSRRPGAPPPPAPQSPSCGSADTQGHLSTSATLPSLLKLHARQACGRGLGTNQHSSAQGTGRGRNCPHFSVPFQAGEARPQFCRRHLDPSCGVTDCMAALDRVRRGPRLQCRGSLGAAVSSAGAQAVQRGKRTPQASGRSATPGEQRKSCLGVLGHTGSYMAPLPVKAPGARPTAVALPTGGEGLFNHSMQHPPTHTHSRSPAPPPTCSCRCR